MARLRLLVFFPDPVECDAWIDALRTVLPGVIVQAWQTDSAPADYAMGWNVPPQLFLAQPGLKAFFAAGAGVNDLLDSGQLPPQLPLLRIEDAGMGEQMADYCMAAVLRWYTHCAEYVSQQSRQSWRPLPAEQRADWTVGVFGGGALGQAVLERLQALGFPVRVCTRRRRRAARWPAFATAGNPGELDEFLRGCRVLVLIAPLTAETRALFDAARLGRLQRGAWVINVARGALLVEPDLLQLLDSGHLAGAQLDVFATEPLPAGHPFWRHPRIAVTPHVAAYTPIGPAARQLAAQLHALEAGLPVAGRVDRERGY